MDKEYKKFIIFVDELRRIARVSRVYAVAGWYTLSDSRRKDPLKAAKEYKKSNGL